MWDDDTSWNEKSHHRKKSNWKGEAVPVTFFDHRQLDLLDVNPCLWSPGTVASSILFGT